MLPKTLFQDFEVFYSCAPLPLYWLDPVNGIPPVNNLAIQWSADQFLALYRLTGDTHWLAKGEYCLAVLSLFQQVWSPPYLTPPYLFGGFGRRITMANGMICAARAFVSTYADYYKATGNAEYLERAVAACRSSFAGMDTEENHANRINQYHQSPGYSAENQYHGGGAALQGGDTGFNWSAGGALSASAYLEKHFGSVWVDGRLKRAVPIDGVKAQVLSWEGQKISLRVESALTKLPHPYVEHRRLVVKFGRLPQQQCTITINGKDYGTLNREQLESGVTCSTGLFPLKITWWIDVIVPSRLNASVWQSGHSARSWVRGPHPNVVGVYRAERVDLLQARKDRHPRPSVVPGLEHGVAKGADIGIIGGAPVGTIGHRDKTVSHLIHPNGGHGLVGGEVAPLPGAATIGGEQDSPTGQSHPAFPTSREVHGVWVAAGWEIRGECYVLPGAAAIGAFHQRRAAWLRTVPERIGDETSIGLRIGTGEGVGRDCQVRAAVEQPLKVDPSPRRAAIGAGEVYIVRTAAKHPPLVASAVETRSSRQSAWQGFLPTLPRVGTMPEVHDRFSVHPYGFQQPYFLRASHPHVLPASPRFHARPAKPSVLGPERAAATAGAADAQIPEIDAAQMVMRVSPAEATAAAAGVGDKEASRLPEVRRGAGNWRLPLPAGDRRRPVLGGRRYAPRRGTEHQAQDGPSCRPGQPDVSHGFHSSTVKRPQVAGVIRASVERSLTMPFTGLAQYMCSSSIAPVLSE